MGILNTVLGWGKKLWGWGRNAFNAVRNTGWGRKLMSWGASMIPKAYDHLAGLGRDAVGRMVNNALGQSFDGNSKYANAAQVQSKMPIIAQGSGPSAASQALKSRLEDGYLDAIKAKYASTPGPGYTRGRARLAGNGLGAMEGIERERQPQD